MPDCQPDLSIIIPFYDEVAFLSMALNSILSQPIERLEVLLINDNPLGFSTEFFAPFFKDDRVRLIEHQKNEGLPVARNTGIAHARGRWVGFLDADDYYLADGLAKQLAFAKNTCADMTHALHLKRGIGEATLRRNVRENSLFRAESVEAGLIKLPEAQFINSSWCSLYSEGFLARTHLRFDPELRQYEDRAFVLRSITQARTIAFSGILARVYRKRGQSITTRPQNLESDLYKLKQFAKCREIMEGFASSAPEKRIFERREAVITILRFLSHKGLVRRIERVCRDGNEEVQRLLDEVIPRASLTQILEKDDLLRKSANFKRLKPFLESRGDLDAIREALIDGDYHRAADLSERLTPGPQTVPYLKSPLAAGPQLDKDVVLHIGLHKTGTTFLQRSLLAHRDRLEEIGFIIPRAGLPKPNARTVRADGFNGHSGLLRPLRVRVPAEENTWNALMAECAISNAQKVLITSENLLAPFHHNRIKILRKLANRLRCFRSVRVIAILRRPDRWIESLYGERLVQGEAEGAMTAGEFAADFGPRLLDFQSMFGPLEDALGQRVEFLDYDAACRRDGLWDAFWSHLGRRDIAKELLPHGQRVYQSPSADVLSVAQIVCSTFQQKQKRRDVLRALLALQSRETRQYKTRLLSEFEARNLIELFEEHHHFARARGYCSKGDEMRGALALEEHRQIKSVSRELLESFMHVMAQTDRPSDGDSI
ncbi:MAG: glycosyltransferase family 2 protein [Pseudomonadota bacterium]